MIKYELKSETVQLKDKKDIHEGCSLEQEWMDPELIRSFDEKDKALEELKKYSTVVEKTRPFAGRAFYEVKEYFVEEVEYNEEGDIVNSGNIWEYSRMPEMD